MSDETITLPCCGLVLTAVRDGLMWQADLPQSPGHFRLFGPVTGAPDWSATAGNYAVRGTRAECLAHIGRVATETLSALLPPGAIVLQPDDPETREAVARAIYDDEMLGPRWDELRSDMAKATPCASVRYLDARLVQPKLRTADAVLAALRERAR